MDINRQNQIESYLSGQMSPEEVSQFESLLEVNPELQQQLQFQSEIIQGIGEFRKAELKARLEALDPTPAWYSLAQLSPVGQFVGGGVVASLVAVGGFWIAGLGNEEIKGDGIIVDAPLPLEISFPLPEFEVPMIEELEAKAVESRTVEVRNKKRERPVEKKFNPVVAVPTAGDVEEESEFKPEELPTPEKSTEDNTAEKAIDVEIIESKTTKIKYRYYEGKLFLYGKFRDEPYQILEINSAAGRRIFLYHKSVFYGIVQSNKALPLVEVTDAKLIQELSILRKAK